jgi:hypothetical protein
MTLPALEKHYYSADARIVEVSRKSKAFDEKAKKDSSQGN